MLKTFSLCGLLAISQTVFGLVEIEMNPKTAPEVVFSLTSPNRITCSEGSITGMHFDENRFQGAINERTGEAFLTPRRELQAPSMVSLTTSFGETQSLLVNVKEAKGEIVVLKRSKEVKKEALKADALPPLSTDYHSKTIKMLEAILDYKQPPGFAVRDPQKIPAFPVESPLNIEPLFFYEGPFDAIFVFSLENPSKKPLSINTRAMKSPGERWVFCPHRWLRSGEKTLLIVCREAKEESRD